MILFADSSALVKLYIAEAGSERMRAISTPVRVSASLLTYGEIYSTFARRRRERMLSPEQHTAVCTRFERDWGSVLEISLDDEVLAEIPRICELYPLRGADSLQLASALRLRQHGMSFSFACCDQKLLAAASAEGLRTLNPEEEG